jgi:FAD/FMN-containing dehydrogenase
MHRTASFEFTDCVDACRVAMDIRAQGLNLVDAQVIRPTVAAGSSDNRLTGYVLQLAFAGGTAAVQRSQAEARNLAAGAKATEFDWGRQRSGSAPVGLSPTGRPLSVRAHLLPSHVPAFIRAVEGDGPAMWDAAPTLGEVAWVWPGEGDRQQWIERALAAATRLGGTLQVQFCPPELKRQIDVFGPPPPSFPLMRAIKQQFDPNNVLSPGRFVGRL